MRRMLLAGLALIATGASDAPKMPGWLAGCWSEQKGSNWSEECWTGPRAGNMLGSARIGRAGSLQSWETMQIEQSSDGSLTFYASPRGAPRSAFPMISSGPREIVFANPKHDYPQRIRYWREGMDLNAEISLIDGSNAFRWRYKRQGGN